VSTAAYFNDSILPWQANASEDQRFKKWLMHGVGIFAVIALLMPWLPTPEANNAVLEKQRSDYTRLIITEPPKPVSVKPKPAVKKPAPIVQKKIKPSTKKFSVAKQKPKPKPVDLAKQARDKAAKAGVLAFADDLASMRDQVDVSKVQKSGLTRAAASAEQTQRQLLTSKQKASVSGISSAVLSTNTGGVALAAHESQKIAVADDSVISGSEAYAATEQNYTGRSTESVRKVMDANKGAIFGIYNRALRSNPGLAGVLIFSIVIEPSGVISDIKLVSSELDDKQLIKKLLNRISMINFGAQQVSQTRVEYSFDFIPH